MTAKRDPSLSDPPELDDVPTLRDLFAAAAIMGCLPGEKVEPEQFARWAYRMADAMLAVRAQ
jgi:hypothetical protein